MIHALKNWRQLSLLIAVIGGMSSCESADQFYEFQKGTPEVQELGTYSYNVGDTIKFVGRLNPADLKINIGDVAAKIAAVETQGAGALFGNRLLDRVKVVVTREMGSGPGVPVSVESLGQKINLKPIDILPDQNVGLIPHKLKLTRRAKPATRLSMMECLSGTGTIFYWDHENKGLFKMLKDDTEIKIIEESSLSDENGEFKIDFVYAGGIDSKEQTLYFIASTKDNIVNPNPSGNVWRLVQCDLTNRKCEVLNRSYSPSYYRFLTMDLVLPFEGKIKDVKIINSFDKIKVMDDGTVYFFRRGYYITKMDPNRDYRYVFKMKGFNAWDSKTDQDVPDYVMIGMLPGVFMNPDSFNPFAIAPDEHIFYNSYNRVTSLWDVKNKYMIQSFESKEYKRDKKPVTNVSFESYYSVGFNSFFGEFSVETPLPGRRLLGVFYQNKNGKNYEDFPVFGIINFKTKKINRYSPGKTDFGNHLIWSSRDRILNYDEDGMFYATSDEKRRLVKTEIIK